MNTSMVARCSSSVLRDNHPMRIVHSSASILAAKKRLYRRTLLAIIILILELAALLTFFRFTSLQQNSRTYNTYPAFSQAREHFVHTIGEYTALRESDPDIGYSDYLQSAGFSSSERRTLRFFIDDYIQFHKQNRNSQAPRLIFKPVGTGIGDRFGVLFFAYWVAVLSRRVLLIDWHDPFPLSDLLEEANQLDILLSKEAASWSLLRGSTFVLNASTESLSIYEKVLSSPIDTVVMKSNKMPKGLSENFLSRFLPEGVSTSHAYGIRGNTNFHRTIMHHVLRLNKPIRQDMEDINNAMNLCPESRRGRNLQRHILPSLFSAFTSPKRPYIAVHARIGRGVGEYPTGRFKGVSENMKTVAICLASRAVRLSYMSGNPALPIFLATDTPYFRHIFEKAVKMVSHSRVEVLTGHWNVVHTTRMRPKHGQPSTPELRNHFRQVMWGTYVDLVMLGHAEHIVALYSSFSRLALALGNAETLIELQNDICVEEERWI